MQLAAPSIAARAIRLALPVRIAVLIGLFVAAFGIRLYHVQDPPLTFHATRQYRSLLLAREYYFEATDSVPAWQREIAAVSAQRQGLLEPPIFEHIVALTYRLVGGEALWLPKLLSSLFWLTGGVFLYRLARRLGGADAALVSTAFYLFLPFGVIASRSFQPDPLMIMLLLGAVLAMSTYIGQPTAARLTLIFGASALAFLVKPIALFPLVAVFLSLSIARKGVRGALWSSTTAGFLVTVLLPTLAIYAYGIASGVFLMKEAEKTLLPQLVLSTFFWEHWLGYIASVISLPVAVAALLGTILLRPGASRALMVGLWVGYAVFCLVVNYNLATHDYYQLQLIPIAALGMAPPAALALKWMDHARPRLLLRTAAIGLLGLGIALAIVRSGSRLGDADLNRGASIAAQIGAEVGHTTRAVYLAADYGVPLEYHGQLSGAAWPLKSDLEWERLAGAQPLTAEERFQRWFAADQPEYFIVLDLSEFDAQPDLKHFLTRNFALAAQQPDYWVFKLRAI
jgi:hypothetical protein